MTVSADMPLVDCVLTLSLLVLLIFMAAKRTALSGLDD